MTIQFYFFLELFHFLQHGQYFLQVSADMAVSTDVPDGHGHVFIGAVADAWVAILSPPGWTPEKTAKLRPLLRAAA